MLRMSNYECAHCNRDRLIDTHAHARVCVCVCVDLYVVSARGNWIENWIRAEALCMALRAEIATEILFNDAARMAALLISAD